MWVADRAFYAVGMTAFVRSFTFTHRRTHSSQMYTPGPQMIRRTSASTSARRLWQNDHRSSAKFRLKALRNGPQRRTASLVSAGTATAESSCPVRQVDAIA